MSSIITAAPMTHMSAGTKDGSTRERIGGRVPVPSHLPLVFTYAQKGDTELNLVAGDTAILRYGNELFDVRSKFATHQTVLANELNSVGNAMMIKRVIPDDAPPAANVRISIDVVKTPVNPKKREADGRYLLDRDGQPQNHERNVPGYKVKFVAEYIAPDSFGASTFGKGQPKIGTLLGNSSEESRRYPLFDLEVSSQGSWGNLQGIRIWTDDINGQYPLNEGLVRKQRAFPYFFSFIEKMDADATARPVYSDYGEQYVQLTLKPDTFDLDTDTDYYVGTELLRRWALPDQTSHLKRVGPFGRLHVYQDTLDDLHEKFAAAEREQIKAYPGMNHDLISEKDDDDYRFNIFGGHTTQGVPYLSYQIDRTAYVPTERVLRFTDKSNIMATGGGDGTMNAANFAKLVAQEVSQFGDRNSKYMDLIRYPISVFYDTGFPMETKKALGKLIAIRKDIMLALVPSVFGEREPSPAEESSICIALRTIMQAYPESLHFGTPVMRGMIFAHTGRLLSSRYRHRAPLVIEAARKFGKFMGASDGVWKDEYSPDRDPTNRVEMFSEISEAYKPASVRNRDWKSGMIWVDPRDLNEFYWPALRTVYEDDTSILTSALTVFCICELWKIGDRVRTRYSGRNDLSNGQLKERIERDVNEECQGRFADRFEIIPTVDFSVADIRRGYSWLLKIAVRANGMKTVQTLYIEAQRREENEQPTTTFTI